MKGSEWLEIQQERARERQRKISLNNVPEGLKHCTVENWDENWIGVSSETGKKISVPVGKFPKLALKWNPKEHRLLTVFSTDNGNGKTHVATAIWRRSLETHPWGEWWSANDLISAIYDGFSGGPGKDLERKLRRCHILLLDDVGRQNRGSEDARARIAGLICDRYDSKRPTILTTNLNEKKLKAWDPAVCDRVCDRNFSVRVGRSGPSFRRRNYP